VGRFKEVVQQAKMEKKVKRMNTVRKMEKWKKKEK
jgi:hypothetical protein